MFLARSAGIRRLSASHRQATSTQAACTQRDFGRIVELEGQLYFWGEVKAFPAEMRATIENMIGSKLCYFADEASSSVALYEAFMMLAGPYWMSIAASNDRLPILDPDHYLTYGDSNAT